MNYPTIETKHNLYMIHNKTDFVNFLDILKGLGCTWYSGGSISDKDYDLWDSNPWDNDDKVINLIVNDKIVSYSELKKDHYSFNLLNREVTDVVPVKYTLGGKINMDYLNTENAVYLTTARPMLNDVLELITLEGCISPDGTPIGEEKYPNEIFDNMDQSKNILATIVKDKITTCQMFQI